MNDPDVVDGWFRLMEHRRRRFRRRPLAEFSLTTPRTNIPEDAPPLRMTPQGRAEPLAEDRPADSLTRAEHAPPISLHEGELAMNRFDPPGFLDDMTEPQKDRWSQNVSGWLNRHAWDVPARTTARARSSSIR